MVLLDGIATAKSIREQLSQQVSAFRDRGNQLYMMENKENICKNEKQIMKSAFETG